MSRVRSKTSSGEPSLGRVLGGGFLALVGLTALFTLFLGGVMWLFTRSVFVLLS